MLVDLLITNIKHAYTPVAVPKSYQVKRLDNVNLGIKDGIIVAIETDVSLFDAKKIIDAHQMVLLPGFIDGHTHLVHGGSREHEFQQKIAGVAYMDILKQGGGILSTVEHTRNASFDKLFAKGKKSLDRMLEFGVTTMEAKSGYGLDLETEIKQLQVSQALNQQHPIDIYQTYLKAHAVPREFKNNKEAYVVSVLNDMKVIKEKGLAKAVDVFCEKGVFDARDTLRICQKANELDFDLRIHTDEIEDIGGTKIALEQGAKTIDHLIVMSDENIERAAKTNTLCNLLPSTSFYLGKPYARARKMIDSGCMVAINSDYNPGSTPSENLQFSMHLAALKMKLSSEEILTAVTYHPAIGLGLDSQIGTIEVGKQADLVLCDVPNLEYFIYHYGINHVTDVFKNGKHVVKDRRIKE